jgi:nucleoside 2-deoxyribosyltransferase
MARSRSRQPLVIVGGVYRERCAKPSWDEIFGSGGRAASSLARMGASVALFAYADEMARGSMEARAALERFTFHPRPIERSISFDYLHGLDTPRISAMHEPLPPIKLRAPLVVRFGMLEGDAIVKAEKAVYDPQSATSPQSFAANGSESSVLAIVLNRSEAILLTGLANGSVPDLARALRKRERAQAVVIKMGALGAFVSEGSKTAQIPVYQSSQVWKIGSGDAFVAEFSHQWLIEGRSAIESADLASRATAFFCEKRAFATQAELDAYTPRPLKVSARFRKGYRPTVYLAGPFFTLADLWMIEQVRASLTAMGLSVFSPYHNIGHGSAHDVVLKDLDAIQKADLVFAVGDGLDSGTMYEIGYARSRDKPVIVYCESETEEAMKMMLGSGCILCEDFVSAIYRSVWVATAL